MAIDFFDGLEDDNTKTFWQANKAVYDIEVKRPMEELLAELADEFGPGKIFRPNRDVRFSADKSPYKTAIAAVLERGGYVQLSAAGLGVGSGMYMMAADQLQRFRLAVAAEASGSQLVRLIDEARRAGIDVTAHDRLKTAPRGFPKDHPRIDLLCLKGLIAWRQWPVTSWLATPRAKKAVVDFLHRSGPLNGWLDTEVGESTQAETAWR